MMKQPYFNSSNLVSKTDGFVQQLEEAVRLHSLPAVLPPTALLILDMQDYFLNPESHAFVPSSPAIIPGINRLISKFNESGQPVIFTRHLNSPHDAQMMKHWWNDLIRGDAELSQITQTVNSKGCRIITKTQYDAFYRTILEATLQSIGIHNLIICGLITHLCCETTARSAFVKGFNVIFPVDGTATYNENYHLGSLRSLAHGFAITPTVNQIVDTPFKSNE